MNNITTEKLVGIIILAIAVYIVAQLLFEAHSPQKKLNVEKLDSVNNDSNKQEQKNLSTLIESNNLMQQEETTEEELSEESELSLNSLPNFIPNPLGMDNRVKENIAVRDTVPYVMSASDQPAYLMHGESLVKEVGIDDAKVLGLVQNMHTDNDAKQLLDGYANFRGETNQDANNEAEDAVDRINRLYRSNNQQESNFFQGKKIKDVFNLLTGANEELKDNKFNASASDDLMQVYANYRQ